MKTQELIKLLKKNRCHVLRNGRKHDIWISSLTGKQFTVPRHKSEIPVGTLKNILRDSGIDL